MEELGPLVAALRSFFRRESKRLGVEAAFLLGSRTVGAARPDSDIDVAVILSTSGDARAAFDRANEIALDLGRVLGSEIDVVVLDRDFSRPMLAYNAIVKGVPLYLNDAGSLPGLRNEALRQMEDFTLFGIEWQLATARRNLESSRRA